MECTYEKYKVDLHHDIHRANFANADRRQYLV